MLSWKNFPLLALVLTAAAGGIEEFEPFNDGEATEYTCCAERSFDITLWYNGSTLNNITRADRNISDNYRDGLCVNVTIPNSQENNGIVVRCYGLGNHSEENNYITHEVTPTPLPASTPTSAPSSISTPAPSFISPHNHTSTINVSIIISPPDNSLSELKTSILAVIPTVAGGLVVLTILISACCCWRKKCICLPTEVLVEDGSIPKNEDEEITQKEVTIPGKGTSDLVTPHLVADPTRIGSMAHHSNIRSAVDTNYERQQQISYSPLPLSGNMENEGRTDLQLQRTSSEIQLMSNAKWEVVGLEPYTVIVEQSLASDKTNPTRTKKS